MKFDVSKITATLKGKEIELGDFLDTDSLIELINEQKQQYWKCPVCKNNARYVYESKNVDGEDIIVINTTCLKCLQKQDI